MALIFILLALLSFGAFGVGSTSTGTSAPTKARPKVHHVNCKARMSAGESRRNGCGGPPANP
jgi:hypothetical protein